MRRTNTAWAALAALALGAPALALTSGCQPPPPAPPPASVDTVPAPALDWSEPAAPATEAPSVSEPVPAVAEPSLPDATPESPPVAEPEPSPTPAPDATPAPEPAVEPAPQPEPAAEPQPEPSAATPAAEEPAERVAVKPAPLAAADIAAISPYNTPDGNPEIPTKDWPMWGGTSLRNNVPAASGGPLEWELGGFDRATGAWQKEKSRNIKWVAQLGSQTYGNPMVANGKVLVGTNNSGGWLKRYVPDLDLGCLLCFDEQTGEFLWQHSSEKLPTGRVHDWPLQGICSSPLVEGDRVWFVSSRGLVICLDLNGYYDGKDDGPVQNEWARQFDLVRPIEPDEPDLLAEALDAIKDNQLSPGMRSNFERVGIELPEQVEIVAKERGRGWMFQAQSGGALREFQLRMEGPKLAVYRVTTPDDKHEADTLWEYDMMKELGISQHNMCSCSVASWGDILFVITGNGVDESHVNLPAPTAASFIALDKNTGELLWTDNSPGVNVLHGQWSSPAIGVLGGVPQVIMPGGDGWLYSFRADRGQGGKPELLWKFDANPKTTKWILGGRGTRNNIIATPVIYDGKVFVAVGQDPEHGEGVGHLWCVDPTKRGDVSPQLAVQADDRTQIIPHRRLQAVIEEEGEVAIDNPNSAVIWHYSQYDRDGDGKIGFDETMHRTIGTVAIKNDLLFISDFSGLFHCLDAKTGKPHWTYDMLAAAWGSPLIAGDYVYIGDEDGDVAIFNLSAEPHDPITEINMENSVYSTPIIANGVLYISNRTHLFAIQESAE